MCDRFIKFIPSEEALFLLYKKPNAFILLTIIAERARRTSGHPDGLEIGEALIGDHEEYSMSRQEYRTALQILIQRKTIEKVETCRTRKKSTTGTTTVGTRVRLLNLDVWDINPQDNNHRFNHRATTEQPPSNHEQERIRKNKKEKERNILPLPSVEADDFSLEKNLESKISSSLTTSDKITNVKLCSQTASPPRTEIFFSFDLKLFQNIQKDDLQAWNLTYPAININQEILKMTQWCLSNPGKAKSKKLWRKFITGWLSRVNEEKINKAPFQKPVLHESTSNYINKDIVDILESRKAFANKFIKENWTKFRFENRPQTMPEFVWIGNDKLYYKDENWDNLFPHFMKKSIA